MVEDERKHEFIEALYREHYGDLKRFSYHYVHSDAKFIPFIEDCIQETFVKATINYRKLITHNNVIGWLVKTCRNELSMCMRKYLRYHKHFGNNVEIDVESAEALNDDLDRWIRRHDAEGELRCIYMALTPLEQRVFEDFYTNDLSLKETADKQGMTENAVHCSAKRIRHKARQIAKSDLLIIFLLKTISNFFSIAIYGGGK